MRNAVCAIATFMIAMSLFQMCFSQESKVPVAAEKLGADIAAKIAKENQIAIDLFKQIQASEEALKSIVLVDVRGDNETRISVIPGAITKAQFEANPDKYKGKTAICYCLSGGRSGKYVKQLKAKDVPAVDLKGSLLGWCGAGLPLTTLDGKPTKRVNTLGNKVPSEYESIE